MNPRLASVFKFFIKDECVESEAVWNEKFIVRAFNSKCFVPIVARENDSVVPPTDLSQIEEQSRTEEVQAISLIDMLNSKTS